MERLASAFDDADSLISLLATGELSLGGLAHVLEVDLDLRDWILFTQ